LHCLNLKQIRYFNIIIQTISIAFGTQLVDLSYALDKIIYFYFL